MREVEFKAGPAESLGLGKSMGSRVDETERVEEKETQRQGESSSCPVPRGEALRCISRQRAH